MNVKYIFAILEINLTNFVQIQNPIIKDIKGYLMKKKKINFFSYFQYSSNKIFFMKILYFQLQKAIIKNYERYLSLLQNLHCFIKKI